MRRYKMKLGDFLRQVGDLSVYETLPGGDHYVDEISKITGVSLDSTTANGTECIRALGKLSASQRTVYLNKDLESNNNSIDVEQLGQLISRVRAGQSGWKTAVAVGMAILVGVVVINHAFLMYLAMVNHYNAPRWQDSVYISIIPGGIVWTWYGVLTRENRDLISAALGELPKKGPWGAVFDMLSRRGSQQQPQGPQQPAAPVTPTPPPYVPPQDPTTPPYDTGPQDGPNDNPPPGMADQIQTTQLGGFTDSAVKR